MAGGDGLGDADAEDGVLESDGEEVPDTELSAGEIGEQVGGRTASEDDIVFWTCAEKQSWKLDLVDDDAVNDVVASVVTDVVVMTVVVHVGGIVSGGKLTRFVFRVKSNGMVSGEFSSAGGNDGILVVVLVVLVECS